VWPNQNDRNFCSSPSLRSISFSRLAAGSSGAGDPPVQGVRFGLAHSPGGRPLEPTHEPASCTPEQNAGLRVLVVGDSRDAVDSLVILLDMWGHEAQAAYDADAAYRAVAADPPDVVLIDLGLPGHDGFALAAGLRAQPGMQSARFFAVSGHSAPAHRDRALGEGFDDFLLKPFDPDSLRGLLAGLPRAPRRI
jgi:CheY-like chemotaxis protein